MIASDSVLDKLLVRGDLFIEGISRKYLNPASCDVPIASGRVWVASRVFTSLGEGRLKKFASYRGELPDIVLESDKLYIIEGPEISIPRGYVGLVDAKSTTGRLGLKVDLITEVSGTEGVNLIPPGYSGRTWFMLSPHVPVVLEKKDPLVQLRLRKAGSTPFSSQELASLYGKEIMLTNGRLIPFSKAVHGNSTIVRASVSRVAMLRRDVSEPVIYGAKEKHEPSEYWKFFINRKSSFELRRGELYLMGTAESYFTGQSVCWKLHPLSDLFSRFVETHRAGFVDPGFNSTITLEIKNHFEDTVVFENQIVTLADWEAVEGRASEYSGHYQGQVSPALPRQFRGYRKIWGELDG